MAKIISMSGAWKSILKDLNNTGYYPEKPSEISNLLKKAKKELKDNEARANQQIQEKIEVLKKNLQELEKNFESELQKTRNQISNEIETVQLELDIFQNGMGWIQKLINYKIIKKYKTKLSELKKKYKNCSLILKRKIVATKNDLDKTQSTIDDFVSNECKDSRNKVFILQSVLASPNFAGAIAEMELIEKLKTLPDNYYLINDVKISLVESIRFDGEWLTSAQIDHLVISPYGIFVIEVKNWSKKFTLDGNYFDPYQQVKRARYLCYRVIGEKYNLQARSIIAYKGSIPKKPPESQSKVLQIEKVKDYILRFKDTNADNNIVEEVVNFIINQ
ncbi:MAG: NERD domain-containing protein [Anaerolineales bacterium]|nr:NERD domain-containing protein [Anaerolineales bacterium]